MVEVPGVTVFVVVPGMTVFVVEVAGVAVFVAEGPGMD